MDCKAANLNSSDIDLSEHDLDVVEFELDNSDNLTPTDSIQNLHHEHHLNHHSPHHCYQHYKTPTPTKQQQSAGDHIRSLSPTKCTATHHTLSPTPTSLGTNHNHQNNHNQTSNGKTYYSCYEDTYFKQLSTLRNEEKNLLKEIELLENTTIEEDDEELIEFQRIERDIKLSEINKCLLIIRKQIEKQEAELFQINSQLAERQNLRAPLAESEGDTDSQVSSRNNESPAIISPNPVTSTMKPFSPQRFVHLSDSSSDDDNSDNDHDESESNIHNGNTVVRHPSPSMIHEILLQERIERSLANVGQQQQQQQDELNCAMRCMLIDGKPKIDGNFIPATTVTSTTLTALTSTTESLTERRQNRSNDLVGGALPATEEAKEIIITTNTGSEPFKNHRRGSEYENQDYHQCHSTHQKSLELLEPRQSRLGKQFIGRDNSLRNPENSITNDRQLFRQGDCNGQENNNEDEEDVEAEEEMIFGENLRRFPRTTGVDQTDENEHRERNNASVILRTQPATSSSSLASNAHRPLTLYLPSANSQLNLITHLHALGHDLTNSVVTNNLLITPYTCSGYLYKQCTRTQVGRKKWRKRYFHFNRIRSIFVYFDERSSFEKHQHPKKGVFFDEIQDVYVDHTKSKVATTSSTPASKCLDDGQQSHSTTGRCVFVVSTTEMNRKFTLSTFVPELMRIWMDVIFTGANGYLQDYEEYEN